MLSLSNLKKELRASGTKERAKSAEWFFKTAPGQYGHGDVFLGLTVPKQREVAKKYIDLSLDDVEKLLHSKEHEFRLTALLILVYKYKSKTGNPASLKLRRTQIYKVYLRNTKWINNWDLVDCTASNIVGEYLASSAKASAGQRKILYKLAKSKNLWEKRIAIISTLYFIVKENKFKTTLEIAEILLKDEHDLIHKAVGWMLREIGKRDLKAEEKFLNKHIHKMPKTMLRYAIEKFPEEKRKYYLKK
ncbi:MAG: DNA alkylation repair protein [Candidatus Paceibacterota bacterium]|jgi:3-methyladenine DNA glycosylase AlkD